VWEILYEEIAQSRSNVPTLAVTHGLQAGQIFVLTFDIIQEGEDSGMYVFFLFSQLCFHIIQ